MGHTIVTRENMLEVAKMAASRMRCRFPFEADDLIGRMSVDVLRTEGQPVPAVIWWLRNRERHRFTRRRNRKFPEPLDTASLGYNSELPDIGGMSEYSDHGAASRQMGSDGWEWMLDGLDGRERDAIDCHYRLGMTHEEIGHRLGISRSQAQSVLERARGLVSDRLHARGIRSFGEAMSVVGNN